MKEQLLNKDENIVAKKEIAHYDVVSPYYNLFQVSVATEAMKRVCIWGTLETTEEFDALVTGENIVDLKEKLLRVGHIFSFLTGGGDIYMPRPSLPWHLSVCLSVYHSLTWYW